MLWNPALDMKLPADPQVPMRRLALLLDLDGTLLELAPSPDAVVVPPHLPGLLDDLATQLNGALALVSGRPIPSIDALLRPFRGPAAGLHGTELRLTRDADIEHAVIATSPRALLGHVPSLVRPGSDLLIEDKGACLAIHHRLEPIALTSLKADILAAMGRHAPDLELLEGRLVLEIKPRSVDKGTACQRLLSTPAFAARMPIYFGDDTTDLDAFRHIDATGGWSVGVGPRAADRARHRMSGPADVLGWLGALLAALRPSAS